MKVLLLACTLVLAFFSTQAQDFAPDSTIIIKNQKVYPVTSSEDLAVKGQIDAENYYKKYKGASTGTLITSLISPLLGLIPAIACSATTPKLKNLGYPDETLFRQAAYHASYTNKAKKIKKRKVWTNWGIGFGVNIVIVLIATAGAN